MSQLTEVGKNSLQALMNKAPSEMTDSDVEAIVALLRADRAKFLEEEAKPKTKSKHSASPEMSLSDLDL